MNATGDVGEFNLLESALRLSLDCPAGRLTCERMPLGKVAVSRRSDGSVRIEADAESFEGRFEGDASRVEAGLNGRPLAAAATGGKRWTIGAR